MRKARLAESGSEGEKVGNWTVVVSFLVFVAGFLVAITTGVAPTPNRIAATVVTLIVLSLLGMTAIVIGDIALLKRKNDLLDTERKLSALRTELDLFVNLEKVFLHQEYVDTELVKRANKFERARKRQIAFFAECKAALEAASPDEYEAVQETFKEKQRMVEENVAAHKANFWDNAYNMVRNLQRSYYKSFYLFEKHSDYLKDPLPPHPQTGGDVHLKT